MLVTRAEAKGYLGLLLFGPCPGYSRSTSNVLLSYWRESCCLIWAENIELKQTMCHPLLNHVLIIGSEALRCHKHLQALEGTDSSFPILFQPRPTLKLMRYSIVVLNSKYARSSYSNCWMQRDNHRLILVWVNALRLRILDYQRIPCNSHRWIPLVTPALGDVKHRKSWGHDHRRL